MQETVVKLAYPFEYDGKTIDSITLKPIKGKHIKGMAASPTIDDLRAIAQRVSGQPNAVFDEMHAADVLTVAGKVGDFLADGREIGSN